MNEHQVPNPIAVYLKSPGAILDYTVPWADWLTSPEELATAAWTISPNDGILTLFAESNNATAHSIILSGGKLGRIYQVTSRITTTSSPPRVDSRTFAIQIVNR